MYFLLLSQYFCNLFHISHGYINQPGTLDECFFYAAFPAVISVLLVSKISSLSFDILREHSQRGREDAVVVIVTLSLALVIVLVSSSLG